MLSKTYSRAKDVAGEVYMVVGRSIRAVCDLDRIKKIPRPSGYAGMCIAELEAEVKKTIADCWNHLFATTLVGALLDLFTFIKYPELSPHNNSIEQIICRRIVVASRQKDPLPNWTAVRNLSIVQMFAVTCEKRGMSVYDTILSMKCDLQ